VNATDVLTARNDNSRSGQNLEETVLNTKNVNPQQFGKLYTLPVDGYVYAQPLYKSQLTIPGSGVRDVVFVTTEHASVYAFDASGKNLTQGYLWKVSFIDSSSEIRTVPAADVGTNDIVPEIGITGTPVIDSNTNTLYVVAKTKELVGGTPNWVQTLHALDLATGMEKMNGPIKIQAAIPGWGAGSSNNIVSFDPRIEDQRAALAIVNGGVYIAWAAHGDQGQYHGWVIGYSTNDIRQQLGAWSDTPNGLGGGIWMSGGGIAADTAGNLYVASGNGTFQPSYENYGDTAFRLSTGKGIQLADSFTPNNQLALDAADNDMGTSDMLLLPTQPGTRPHLLITADKSGTLYLLDRDNLGGYSNTNLNNDVDEISIGSTIHNNLSYFNGSIYVGGDGNPVITYQLANGTVSHTPNSRSQHSFGQNYANASGTSVSISANGTSEGIAWALDNFMNGVGPAILFAFDASDLGNLLYSSEQAPNGRDQAGRAVKFTVPTIANGRVFVPNVNAITVYGLLTQPAAQPTAVPVFSKASGAVLAAGEKVAITSATPSATIYFTTDGSTPSILSPVYANGLSITKPTTVQAFATAPGFGPSAIVTAFFIPQGDSTPTFTKGFLNASAQLSLNNGAAIVGSRLQLTDGGRFEARSAFFGVPLNIERFATEFSFELSNADADGFTFTIQGDSPQAVGASGGGLGYGADPEYHVSSSERSIGHSVAIKFDLYNNAGEGNSSIGLSINGATPTVPAFDLLPSGIDLHSGHIIDAKMNYDGSNLNIVLRDREKPTAIFSITFRVDIVKTVEATTAFVGFTAGTGYLTSIEEILNWRFQPNPSFQNGFSSESMMLNGSALIRDSKLILTDGGQYEAASSFFPNRVEITSFTSDFTFQLTNAAADGFTFTIQNQDPHSVGASGGGLGYGIDPTGTDSTPGINQSVAVKFDLYDNQGEGNNSIGIYANAAPLTTDSLNVTGSGIDLHSGAVYHVHLTYDGFLLGVVITDPADSRKVFSTSKLINIPQSLATDCAYVGFTGGTGGLSAVQEILSFTFQGQF
jgi:hypothetical protein